MATEETIINQRLANLDLSTVAALQQKRTLAFVNHFVTTTVQFLNNFMKKCELKLMQFERKLEKVEAAMVLLEARLSSIPEVSMQQTEPKPNIPDPKPTEDLKENPQQKSTEEPEQIIEISEDVKSALPVQPEYERFVKMVQVGVPLQAVKLKVSLEGLDPSVLEKILNK